MNALQVPAGLWQQIASACSCHLAVENKSRRPVSVLTAEYRGFLYTALGIVYGPYGMARKLRVGAYRLLPKSMYAGETTLASYDEEVIRTGQRDRGNHTSLTVSANGGLMVCAERVQFLMELPDTRPLSLDAVKSYESFGLATM